LRLLLFAPRRLRRLLLGLPPGRLLRLLGRRLLRLLAGLLAPTALLRLLRLLRLVRLVPARSVSGMTHCSLASC
jgi:hypothetical protein